MDRQRILIQGSSWSVGAWTKSSTPLSDDPAPGGIAELLGQIHDVTNISVGDDFNIGSWTRLEAHLQTQSNYDLIVICQNDPLRDLIILRSEDSPWRRQFGWDIQDLVEQQIDSVGKLITFLLNLFYSKLATTGIPTVIFAGPSQVDVELAQQYGLTAVVPSWTEVLVPGAGSVLETGQELEYAVAQLMELFPDNRQLLKQELINYAGAIEKLLNTWKTNPDLFAYHHPTPRGNQLFYNYLTSQLQGLI